MAIGLLVLVIALALAMAAKKSPKQVATWAVGGAVVGGLVSATGLLPLFGLTGVGVGLAFGAVAGFLRSLHHAPPKPSRMNFDATHVHDNIALNEHKAQVWVRDEQGREVVLEAREIRNWTHLWVPDRGYKAKNRLQLQTTRLDTPVLTARFERHPATIWGAPRNAAEAEEWLGRLGAFLDR